MSSRPSPSASVLLATLMMTGAAQAQLADPVPYPSAQQLNDEQDFEYFLRSQIWDYQTLDSYQEPEFLSKMVAEGLLPPVEERLPEQPLVYQSAAMADGPGEYGGVLRMVVGARPTGWNWLASNNQGYGGINQVVQECLTKTGSMYKVAEEDREPLPNLAKSWEWSEDGKQLTMNLIRGAHWSDGHPFSADDVMFKWEDNVLNDEVPAPASATTFGENAQLEKIDDYTIRWTFEESFPVLNLFTMANQFCPGPSHVLKEHHPSYNSEKTYGEYTNALGPNVMPWVTMGAWTTVEYKADEIMVMRRNPYYWKVDENGTQLPYKNELQVRLSDWSDRTVQTLAGNADLSNMDEPTMLLEGLQKAQSDGSSVRFIFGPRTQGWALGMNFSETNGISTEKEKAIRTLNRDIRFRRALTQAVDREALGQSVVRGPFSSAYAGGLMPESPYFDPAAVVYYPYSQESTKALLAEVGLKDLNGDGYVQWTEGNLAGEMVELNIMYGTGYPVEAILAENIVSMLDEVGLRAILRPLPENTRNSIRYAGEYDYALMATDNAFIIPEVELSQIAAITPSLPTWNVGAKDLQPFEQELVDIVNDFRNAVDPNERAELMRRFNEVFTGNIYTIGMTSVTGVALVNDRMKNVNPSLPMKGYAWSEEGVVRERLWTPKADQIREIFPETIPQS